MGRFHCTPSSRARALTSFVAVVRRSQPVAKSPVATRARPRRRRRSLAPSLGRCARWCNRKRSDITSKSVSVVDSRSKSSRCVVARFANRRSFRARWFHSLTYAFSHDRRLVSPRKWRPRSGSASITDAVIVAKNLWRCVNRIRRVARAMGKRWEREGETRV